MFDNFRVQPDGARFCVMGNDCTSPHPLDWGWALLGTFETEPEAEAFIESKINALPEDEQDKARERRAALRKFRPAGA